MHNGELTVVKNRHFYGTIITCFFPNNDLTKKIFLIVSNRNIHRPCTARAGAIAYNVSTEILGNNTILQDFHVFNDRYYLKNTFIKIHMVIKFNA